MLNHDDTGADGMQAFLREVPVLSGLSDGEIGLLARAATERRAAAGERIVNKDEAALAAFILKAGAAEARIDKPGGAPLHLSKIAPGELFGELALFDDSPRSATVVALEDSTLVEIRRDQFLREVAANPQAALKLLAIVARRLRRAESIVSDYADRIYGDVLPRLQDAVAAQLQSARTICEETRARAESTIAQARHLQESTDRHWTNLLRLVTVVGAVGALVFAIATFFGLESVRNWSGQFADQLQQTRDLTREAGAYVETLRDETYSVGELMRSRHAFERLQLEKLRRDLQLGDVPALSGGADAPRGRGLSLLAAYHALMETYLERPETWETEFLMSALDAVLGITERRYIVMDARDWGLVIAAVMQALRRPPAAEDWRERQRLSELVVRLHASMIAQENQLGARDLVRRMEAALTSASLAPGDAALTALVLAELGSDSAAVKAALTTQLDGNPWRASQAAIALIVAGDDRGWEPLRRALAAPWKTRGSAGAAGDDTTLAAYAAAQQLADRAVAGGPRLRARLGHAALQRELTAGSLSHYLDPWPDEAGTGAELVARTLLGGLASAPPAWNRFYWQYACDLLCGLGCQAPGATDGGHRCSQCRVQMHARFTPQAEPPRTDVHSCGAST